MSPDTSPPTILDEIDITLGIRDLGGSFTLCFSFMG
jgi:hypothetical protein